MASVSAMLFRSFLILAALIWASSAAAVGPTHVEDDADEMSYLNYDDDFDDFETGVMDD